DMVQETQLTAANLIFPLFVMEGSNVKSEVQSMPGIYRYTIDNLLREVEQCMELGLRAFDLFPNIDESLKDKYAAESTREGSLYLRAIAEVKRHFPEACVITDVAMDPYSSDGHDGVVENGEILNDETLVILGQMALAHARAGADMVAPSDMMDGRTGHIRNVLDENGYTNVSLMSYTAKYASAFYGPFRDALNSAPKHGDKKTYQMDPSNQREALIEAALDTQEGADFLMVKPALAYLDVIKLLHDGFDMPIAAYNVSGEYAMIKASRSEEHTSELQSRENLVCRLLLEKKNSLTHHE